MGDPQGQQGLLRCPAIAAQEPLDARGRGGTALEEVGRDCKAKAGPASSLPDVLAQPGEVCRVLGMGEEQLKLAAGCVSHPVVKPQSSVSPSGPGEAQICQHRGCKPCTSPSSLPLALPGLLRSQTGPQCPGVKEMESSAQDKELQRTHKWGPNCSAQQPAACLGTWLLAGTAGRGCGCHCRW